MKPDTADPREAAVAADLRALAQEVAKDWNGRVVSGDDLRAAIGRATPLNNPRLSEVDWDEVAGALATPSTSTATTRCWCGSVEAQTVHHEDWGHPFSTTIPLPATTRDVGGERLREALTNFVDNDTDHFDYEGVARPGHSEPDPARCPGCRAVRQGWYDEARAALAATTPSVSDEGLPTADELAQALTECAPARPGIYAEAEAILHELRKNRAALATTSEEPVSG